MNATTETLSAPRRRRRPVDVAAMFRTTRFARRWAPWLVVLNLFGYPIVGLFSSLLDIDSVIASIPFRALVLLLSLYVIFVSARRAKWWRKNRWLAAFWIVYLLRLVYDAFVNGVPGAAEALGIFVGLCLIPSIASGMTGLLALGEKRTSWYLAFTGGFICTLAVLMYLFGLGAARTIDVHSTGGRLVFEAVNPITLGHVAASTLIALVCLTRMRMPAANHMVLIGIGAIAVWTLLLAGSRGPMVSLACVGIAYAVVTGRFGWILALLVTLGAVLFSTENLIVERFTSAATDVSALERLVVQGNAILQFLASPIYGSAFTELVSLEYPHNLFIETAMALGSIGLFLMLGLLVRTTRLAFRSVRAGHTLIAMLFAQYFIGAQFSGALWGATPLWLTLALLGSYPLVKRLRTDPPPQPAGH